MGVTNEAFSWMSEAFGKAASAISAMANGTDHGTPTSARTKKDPWLASPDGLGMVRTSVYDQAKAGHAEAQKGRAAAQAAGSALVVDVDGYIRTLVQGAIDRAARRHVGLPERVILN